MNGVKKLLMSCCKKQLQISRLGDILSLAAIVSVWWCTPLIHQVMSSCILVMISFLWWSPPPPLLSSVHWQHRSLHACDMVDGRASHKFSLALSVVACCYWNGVGEGGGYTTALPVFDGSNLKQTSHTAMWRVDTWTHYMHLWAKTHTHMHTHTHTHTIMQYCFRHSSDEVKKTTKKMTTTGYSGRSRRGCRCN